MLIMRVVYSGRDLYLKSLLLQDLEKVRTFAAQMKGKI